MLRVRKDRSKILLFPSDQQIKALRRNLPIFKAHDLRTLIGEAKASGKADVDTAFISVFRRRNEIQMKDLLQRLGIDPLRPDAWMRGFFQLATVHHGVGHLAWYARRTNRNSATWTSTHDLALLSEVFVLRERGLSERRAVKILAADPRKRKQFPYRRKGYRFSTTEEPRKREAALWARLQKLKASARDTSILDLVLGMRRGSISSIEYTLSDLDISNLLPKELVKIDGRSKKMRS